MPRKIPGYVLDRLEPFERAKSGRIRNYVDPITGELYTQRDRQQGRSGLSIEAQAAVRKSGNARELERALARKESPDYLVRKLQAKLRAEGKHVTKTEILSDKSFWKETAKLKRENGADRIRALVQLGVMSESYAAAILATYDDDSSDDPPDDGGYYD